MRRYNYEKNISDHINMFRGNGNYILFRFLRPEITL